jgi:hypothetical protein
MDYSIFSSAPPLPQYSAEAHVCILNSSLAATLVLNWLLNATQYAWWYDISAAFENKSLHLTSDPCVYIGLRRILARGALKQDLHIFLRPSVKLRPAVQKSGVFLTISYINYWRTQAGRFCDYRPDIIGSPSLISRSTLNFPWSGPFMFRLPNSCTDPCRFIPRTSVLF